jgi:hypothetical protein
MSEKIDPAWRNKQTIEHTGTVGVVPGLLSKDEILKLSDAELDKMDRALSLQVTALQAKVKTGADDVRSDARGASAGTGEAPKTTD